MDLHLRGKRALITGGSKGIGAAVAKEGKPARWRVRSEQLSNEAMHSSLRVPRRDQPSLPAGLCAMCGNLRCVTTAILNGRGTDKCRPARLE